MMKRNGPEAKMKAKKKSFTPVARGGARPGTMPAMGGASAGPETAVSRRPVARGVARFGGGGAPAGGGLSIAPGLRTGGLPQVGGPLRQPPAGKKKVSKGKTVQNAGLAGGGTMRATVAGGG